MFTKIYPFCEIAIRTCSLCPRVFVTLPRLRRKYCSDLCAATAYASRHPRNYTVEGALAQLARNRTAASRHRTLRRPPRALAPVPRNPIQNTHKRGSIAFLLLYGSGAAFSFNVSDSGDRVTSGGATRAGQVGGPNL